jgi:hypothetical protein
MPATVPSITPKIDTLFLFVLLLFLMLLISSQVGRRSRPVLSMGKARAAAVGAIIPQRKIRRRALAVIISPESLLVLDIFR